MKRSFNRFTLLKFTILPVICLFILLACERQAIKPPQEKILVKIGDKTTISLNEFIRRAEYTPRPPYCRHNNYVHKKIILNSLIAEKLLAIEAGEDNPITRSEEFRAYIKGRKEQAMRQWMHHQEATAQVKLDTAEIKKVYEVAGREYEIAYFSVEDSAVAQSVVEELNRNTHSFKDLYQQVYGDTAIPRRKVAWENQEHLKVHSALFTEKLSVGQVLEPIKLATNHYLIIKISGWSDTKVITEPQVQQRLKNVAEKLTEMKASAIWSGVVGEIMRGKRIDFNNDTFWKLNDIFFHIYFHTDQEKKDALSEKIWDTEENPEKALDEVISEELLQQPFFMIDGQTWTVDDFRRELMSHPLVFRERKMPSDEFSEQFRFAVADLVRDHYITQEAYRRGYDQINVVQRNEQMWRDVFLALYQKNKYLKGVGEKRNFVANYMAIINNRLNAYVDSLQQRYYKQIELDFEEFEKIALTSIDLFVKQKNQPYPHVVPRFPILTTDHLIDYVRRMEK